MINLNNLKTVILNGLKQDSIELDELDGEFITLTFINKKVTVVLDTENIGVFYNNKLKKIHQMKDIDYLSVYDEIYSFCKKLYNIMCHSL